MASAAATSSSPDSRRTHATAASRPPASSCSATALRSRETSSESSSVRPGASPSQKGIVGCLPAASRTRMTPLVTCTICHGCVPSRNTSPCIDSIAKSSLTVPMNVSDGSISTR